MYRENDLQDQSDETLSYSVILHDREIVIVLLQEYDCEGVSARG